MNADMFHGGMARLTCVASIFNLYKKEKEIIIEEDRPTPKPSSVLGTREATAGRRFFFPLVFSYRLCRSYRPVVFFVTPRGKLNLSKTLWILERDDGGRCEAQPKYLKNIRM